MAQVAMQLVELTFIFLKDNNQRGRASELCKNWIKKFMEDSRLEQAKLDESEAFQRRLP